MDLGAPIDKEFMTRQTVSVKTSQAVFVRKLTLQMFRKWQSTLFTITRIFM
jgi:hypothetical protein